MHVEVKKTKLTKSLISQMDLAVGNIAVLKEGKVLGYVANVREHDARTMILEYNGEYYVHSVTFYKNETDIRRRYRTKEMVLYFKTETDCTEYWGHYMKCKLEAEKNHLYV